MAPVAKDPDERSFAGRAVNLERNCHEILPLGGGSYSQKPSRLLRLLPRREPLRPLDVRELGLRIPGDEARDEEASAEVEEGTAAGSPQCPKQVGAKNPEKRRQEDHETDVTRPESPTHEADFR